MQRPPTKHSSVVSGPSSVAEITDNGQRTADKSVFFVYALLTVLTLAVFWPVRHFEFINYDDPEYVTQNPFVQRGLTTDGIAWAFRTNYASNWHPLTWFSHMLDCRIFGMNAGGHHLTNLLLHT